MTSLSFAPCTRLFTTFGTVVYVDAVSGELRHGAIESSPANAVFVADLSQAKDHGRGLLMHVEGEGNEPIACLVDRCFSITGAHGRDGSAIPTLLELVPLERGLIAFQAQGLFLCAEPNGRLTLSRTVCSTWECFLASEDWCCHASATGEEQLRELDRVDIDKKGIQSYIINPVFSAKVKSSGADVVQPPAAKPDVSARRFLATAFSVKSRTPKRVLFFIGVGWAFGSVHSELVKYLHSRGLVSDILDWGRIYTREEVSMMGEYYDCIVGVPGETWPLTDNYGIPHNKIVVVAHGDYDLHHALDTRPADEFERFADYAVISEYLRDLSAQLGIKRVPKIVKYGVNYRRFFAPVSSSLGVVGYGGSMFREDHLGVDWKRGTLAQQATEAAGLPFRPAGNFHFLAMPSYYAQVDAVLVSSSCEGFGLPAMEAAAAGRLVISTPVGGFPYLAARGGGITAPLGAEEYKAFVTEKLMHYKERPDEYMETCSKIQEAALQFDWEYTVEEWIKLIESAMPPSKSTAQTGVA